MHRFRVEIWCDAAGHPLSGNYALCCDGEAFTTHVRALDKDTPAPVAFDELAEAAAAELEAHSSWEHRPRTVTQLRARGGS